MGAFVTRVSLETFIRKGKITEGTNLESQCLVPTSLQFLPGPQDPSSCWSPRVAAHSLSCTLGLLACRWQSPGFLNVTLKTEHSLPPPASPPGWAYSRSRPIISKRTGLFICFVHHHHPSPQKSGWHIIGSL